MKDVILRTRINNKRLSSNVSNEIRVFIEMMDGKEIDIVMKKAKSKRSDRQNRYYFGCVVPIICQALKDLGHDLNKVECHEWLKMKFNYTSIADGQGNHISDIPKSTTRLTKTEFGEFIERVAQFAATHLNVAIPEPNEQTFLELA